MPGTYPDEIVDQIARHLADGKGLQAICECPGMPARNTVWRWIKADDQLGDRLREAREVGFIARAERAVEDAKSAEDPVAGRLAFDAERWYLGKLSQALADKPVAAIGAMLNVDATDAFAAIAGALQEAATARASLSHSTRPVVIDGTARSVDPAGQLADLAGTRRTGLGEDADGG